MQSNSGCDIVIQTTNH